MPTSEPNVSPLWEAEAQSVAMSVRDMMNAVEDLAAHKDRVSTWDILDLSLTHCRLGQLLAALETQQPAALPSTEVRK